MDNGKMFPLGSRTTLFSRKEPKASRIEEAQLNLCNYKKKKTRQSIFTRREQCRLQIYRLWLLVLVSIPSLEIHTTDDHSISLICSTLQKKKSHCHFYMCGDGPFFFGWGGGKKREGGY
jgi:hypothetical protein